MSPISGPVADVLNARQADTNQKIDIALIRKQMDVSKQTGDAINSLLEQNLVAAKQISQGRLDVRV